jgi:hypothetical protein
MGGSRAQVEPAREAWGEYSSMASGTARMRRGTPTRGFWGWGPPGGKPGALDTAQYPEHLTWLARPKQGHLRKTGMPPHSTGAIIGDPHPGTDGWVAVPCPACQDSHGQPRLNVFSGHDVCLAWSLTSDEEGSGASARGGRPLGPHWLEHLGQDRVTQPVVAS